MFLPVIVSGDIYISPYSLMKSFFVSCRRVSLIVLVFFTRSFQLSMVVLQFLAPLWLGGVNDCFRMMSYEQKYFHTQALITEKCPSKSSFPFFHNDGKCSKYWLLCHLAKQNVVLRTQPTRIVCNMSKKQTFVALSYWDLGVFTHKCIM